MSALNLGTAPTENRRRIPGPRIARTGYPVRSRRPNIWSPNAVESDPGHPARGTGHPRTLRIGAGTVHDRNETALPQRKRGGLATSVASAGPIGPRTVKGRSIGRERRVRSLAFLAFLAFLTKKVCQVGAYVRLKLRRSRRDGIDRPRCTGRPDL